MACPSLSRLAAEPGVSLVAVVTQPDRPRGRSLKVTPGPVKLLAQQAGICVLSPAAVNAPEAVSSLRELKPELIAVAAYGQILKPDVLSIPPRGCVNVHASLLPRYRGAAPIQWSIANGETCTGVTTFFMDAGMDTGDIILQIDVPVLSDDTGGSLGARLADEGATLLLRTVAAIAGGTAKRRPQVSADATYARKLAKEDGRIDWTRPAREIGNRVRGFNPWPCCFTRLPAPAGAEARAGTALRVLKAEVQAGSGPPGEVIDVGGNGPLVAAGRDALRLLEVQPEGRNVMSGADYLRGRALKLGNVLDHEPAR